MVLLRVVHDWVELRRSPVQGVDRRTSLFFLRGTECLQGLHSSYTCDRTFLLPSNNSMFGTLGDLGLDRTDRGRGEREREEFV